MTFSPSSLLDQLTAHLPSACSGIAVGFSGGLDSTVLLHALTHGGSNRPVRAIHVNHNLHPNAGEWSLHCASQAAALKVTFDVISVQCDRISEEGLEAAARRARYAALRRCLGPNECLLTAHHADDQAETFLLATIRGAGARGLAAMPSIKPFAAGWHARPLLTYTREELAAYAREQSLTYLDDPANVSERFARNHLRSMVMPALRTRWPDVARRISRTSQRMGEASELMDEVAREDAQTWMREEALSMDGLDTLSRVRRNNLLRWWLRQRGSRAPSAHRLDSLWHDVASAASDRVPHIDVDEVRVFRHGRFLYAEPSHCFEVSVNTVEWSLQEPATAAVGSLRARNVIGAGVAARELQGSVMVRYRNGGEDLQIHSDGPHRTLKNLLQEARVLPWWRDRIPLIYSGDRLVCVADLWVAAHARAGVNESGVVIEWIDRPQQLRAVQ